MAKPLDQPPTVKKTNYLPWILGGCGALLVFWVVILIAAFAIYYYYPPSTNSRTGGRRSSSEVRLVEDHGIQTVQKTWSSCTAFAPADWTIVGNEQRVGMGVDLAAPDQSMAASYGIVAVPRTQMYGGDYYGTGTPEKAIETMMEATGNTGFVFDNDSQSVADYTLRYWRANLHGKPVRGFALYQAIEFGEPSNYILAYHIGETDASNWEQHKNVAYDVAASIRCTKHLFPAQESSTRRPQGSSKDQIESEMSRKRQEATMGFQNVYSTSTGQHWEASYSDYNPTGPDGPGYYRRVGNSYEKLNEGFPPN